MSRTDGVRIKKAKLKKDKERLERLADGRITITSFLSKYLGVRDQRVLSSRITHKDIKAIFPNLKRVSFDYAVDNPTLIGDSTILLVSDSIGRVVPYMNPQLGYEETEYFGEFVRDESTSKEIIPNIDEIDLESLNNYELQQLLHVYEKNLIRGAARKVRKELTSRKDSRHASKESINRALRKSMKNERFYY